MGCRASLRFHDGKTISAVLYLHDQGREVNKLLKQTKEMCTRASYGQPPVDAILARACGIACEEYKREMEEAGHPEYNNGFGIYIERTDSDDYEEEKEKVYCDYDVGVFDIDVRDWTVRIRLGPGLVIKEGTSENDFTDEYSGEGTFPI